MLALVVFPRRARLPLGSAGPSPVPSPERLGLTAREFEVLRLVAASRGGTTPAANR
jgi:hypothetical protein